MIYRVRKSWADAKSQIGAYKKLENAKKAADKKAGYKGFLSSEYEGGEHLRADLDVDSIEQVRRHQAAMARAIGE